MVSIASCWTQSSDLPITCGILPQTSYDPQHKNCIIITTDYEEYRTEPGIYEYNIETNESSLLCKYDQNIEIEYHTQFIDPSNNTLIICAGFDTVHIFDLNTNTLSTAQDTHTLSKCGHISKTTHIPSPINQIHFFEYDDHQHCQFDIKTKSVTMNKVDSFRLSFPQLLYVAFKQKLTVFGSQSDKHIYECHIPQTDNECVWQWNKSEMEMPYCVTFSVFETLLGFDNILFVFYFADEQNKEIHLLDLLNDKWYKSQYCIPEACDSTNSEDYFVMKCDDNVHILNFETNQHFKVCLYDLIPKELIVSHRKYYKGLIMGYVREKESELSIQRVPFVLKHLILLYYQIFS